MPPGTAATSSDGADGGPHIAADARTDAAAGTAAPSSITPRTTTATALTSPERALKVWTSKIIKKRTDAEAELLPVPSFVQYWLDDGDSVKANGKPEYVLKVTHARTHARTDVPI